VNWQREIAKEIEANPIVIEGRITLPREVFEKSADSVKGMSQMDALLSLVSLPLPNQEPIEHSQDIGLFRSLASTDYFDKAHRLVAKVPAKMSTKEGDRIKAQRAELNQDNRIGYCLFVEISLKPRLCVIKLEHRKRMRIGVIRRALRDSKRIPQARTELFARGLLEGLKGEWATSLHLLIPQTENLIREAMRECGVETIKVKEDGHHEEMDLNELLFRPELGRLFGAHFISELRSLLVERTGMNLRNKVCHGLMDSDEFEDQSCIYLWWLILKLLLEKPQLDIPST
jgi:hypothetical protein